MSTWPRPPRLRGLPAIALLAAMLAGCGGGDGRGEDQLGAPQPVQRCATCVAGRLTGTVSLGQPAAAAWVRVIDAAGAQATGRSDDSGRYDLDVTGLTGPLLVQALVHSGGRPALLHGAALATEAGRLEVQVTPVTELIVADALGGHPADLLDAGRAELARLGASLTDSESRVEALLRPLLDALGVDGGIDLRTASIGPGGPLAQALAWLQVSAVDQGYAVQQGADGPSLLLAPGGPAGTAALAAPTPQALADWRAGQAAMPAVQQRLQQLASSFGSGLPEPAALRAWLTDDFLHAGLDAAAYVDRVLRREDAATQGGYSLRGVAFDQLRLLAVGEGGRRLQVAWRVRTAAAQHSWDERMWLRLGDAGWQLAGNGLGGRVRVRHAAVLGPRAQTGDEVRRLPGVVCAIASVVLSAQTRERCAIEGGTIGTPAPGWMDLGGPDEAWFGLQALYRSDADSAAQRLADYAAHSRILGQPSARVSRHLWLDVDAWQSDPRAVQVRVEGPGLPASGVLLYRPPAGSSGASFTLDPRGEDPWRGVELADCAAVPGSGSCAAGTVLPGTGSGYRFALLEASGQVLHTLEARLPSAAPDTARLLAQTAQRFARWRLQDQPAAQPTLARLLGATLPAGAGDALVLSQTWLPPQDPLHQAAWVELTWHRAPLPPATGDPSVLRQRVLLSADTAAPTVARVWETALPAREGQRTVWLSVALGATDALGNLYLHAVSPSNPY
ncbi:hypothetical protein [uncultured Aquincola sp.]|uniref:hypothetical protein n=1 Tax=uncultured Aquincola sp. TaxID=886556 RepID=UPI0032B2C7E0